ncbi:MAG TPA: ASKHA domain-containing protein [Acidobacteriota bacterium]|nr:ASKHA domain-containing protein [Acidobacteriota bacterium]
MPQRRVTFLPDRRSSLFDEGISLRDAALELGILIESSCAGIGTCGECRVQCDQGVAPPTSTELDLLSAEELARGVRLSCQALVQGDCTCTVLPESRVVGHQILEHGTQSAFPLDPDCRKRVLITPAPRLGEKYFDLEALLASLGGCPRPRLDLIRKVPALLRGSSPTVTAFLDQEVLLGIEPGDTSSRLYGLSVDIGTTTVVAKLIDLNSGEVRGVTSALNAQEPHGADVITRAKYVMEHPGGLGLLSRLIIEQINRLLAELCKQAGVSTSDVYKAVFAGNTIMQHLALGIDPRHLVAAPYTPALQGPVTIQPAEIGLSLNENGTAYFLPNLACFVGSDITAVLTTLDLESSDELQLVVDIGTNGEIVLGSRQGLICCSSPAGPAWEGAAISWGMRAAHGAIERMDVQDGDLAYRTIGNLNPIGICGSGLMDLLALLVRTGIVDETGRILDPDEIRRGSCTPLQRRIATNREGGHSFRVVPTGAAGKWIELTQRDVRQLQLAKSAIASAINILLKEKSVTVNDIKRVYIAGAFGNHIRGADAIDIGLLPAMSPDRIHFIGNAAMAGAEAVLCSKQARRKAEALAEMIEYVELAGRSDFQDEFSAALLFPKH